MVAWLPSSQTTGCTSMGIVWLLLEGLLQGLLQGLRLWDLRYGLDKSVY